LKLLNKILDVCTLGLAGIGGLALGFLLLAICYSTFSRVVFNQPLSFLMEYATYTLIYIAFLSGPWILQQRKHISVDIVLEAIHPYKRKVMTTVTDFMGAVICAIVCYFGALVAIGNLQRNVLVMDTMGTPQWVLVAAVPVGMFFMALQFLRHFCLDLQEIKAMKGGTS